MKRLGCAGGSAGIGAFVTNPIETLRVRFQVEPAATRPLSILAFGAELVKNEGFFGGLMLPGNSSWVASMSAAFGLRMMLYDPLRDAIDKLAGGGGSSNAFAAGICTGSLTNALACPFFNAKTRLQACAGAAEGRGLLTELAAVTREGGLTAHYAGGWALFIRGGFLSGGQLWGYNVSKGLFKAQGVKEGPSVHVACSVFAAACAAVLSAPADITLNRYQAALKLGTGAYASAGEVALELVRTEGPLALFRGAGLQFAKVCPVFLLTMPLYEQLRRLVGL